MESPVLTCKSEKRRDAVRGRQSNGIDYVEVVDPHEQRRLRVYFLGTLPRGLTEANVRIDGPPGAREVRVMDVEEERASDPEADDCLLVTVCQPGDFSDYTLRLVEAKDGRPTALPHPALDQRYASVEFNFKAGCPGTLDCKPICDCPPPKRDEPEINYLAKDYASFRQLILDRLSVVMPEWRERHVPDLGITLVELLAYAGDHLSYYQDAVGTEAYLDTARERISIRRHARLVDYPLHEGCNARAWVWVKTSTDFRLTLDGLKFVSGLKEAPSQITAEQLKEFPSGHYEVFEPLWPARETEFQFRLAHNRIQFHTWGDELCCLPRGATTATLLDGWTEAEAPPKEPSGKECGHPPPKPTHEQCGPTQEPSPKPERERLLRFAPGDVLIFEEVIGPRTGVEADADPGRRWAVRLTKVERGYDHLLDLPILEIEWAAEDALPFPFCVSARLPSPDCRLITDISVARGNVILVDHGNSMCKDLGQVPKVETPGPCECEDSPPEITNSPGPFEPKLNYGPLTFSQPLPSDPLTPASVLLAQDPRKALPQVLLTGLPGERLKPDDGGPPKLLPAVDERAQASRWVPRYDLLESSPTDQHFVAEINDAGQAQLRFGDGDLGRRPEACLVFKSHHRIGNGPAGNVGADTITTLVTPDRKAPGLVDGVKLEPHNPLPARGGTTPEPIAEAKLFAPRTFRKWRERAITAEDYAELAGRNPRIQRAGAALRWTGSWLEARVSLDPLAPTVADESFRAATRRRLEPYRRIGHDLDVVPARFVPLDIELCVCVQPRQVKGHVEAALRDVFSNRRLPDGKLGFFHPDRLTFGSSIFVSELIVAAQNVPGVESVCIHKLQRWGEDSRGEIADGVLPIGLLEIAQVENDPSFPDWGQLALKLRGGR